ncbi:MAG: prepilin-type N-terminal cleavage/methylation domain-containing protein [Pseudomonadota bacterium]
MKTRGFTLVELVVAIAISSIVIVFAAMFIGAPLGAYEAHSRRAALVADASGAWPRMEADLRLALPNSLRTRRNGVFVVVEMLPVMDVARYMTSPSAPSFTTAGVYRGAAAPAYLSVNNLGAPGADAYSLTGSMVPAANFLALPGAAPDEQMISVTPAPAFGADSLQRWMYFVGNPVTYLCDEGQGTLRRYSSYTLAANQAALDSPAELAAAGASNELITQGLTSCNVSVTAPGSVTVSQSAAVRLTTVRNGDIVTLLHSSAGQYLP